MILVAPSPGIWSRIALPWKAQLPAPVVTHRFTMMLRSGRSETVDQPHEGVCVRCRSGRLWITHDGDPRDVVLEPGEHYNADSSHCMTVHAVGDSEVEMLFSR